MGTIFRQRSLSARGVWNEIRIIPSGTSGALWGTGVTTTYVDLPDDVQILQTGGPKVEFDKLPWGMPRTAELTIEFSLTRIAAEGPLAALKTALESPYTAGGGDFDLGTDGGGAIEGRSWETATAIMLLTDDGTNQSVWRCKFAGMLRARPTRKGKILYPNTTAGRIHLQVSCVDIFRAATEAVKPIDLMRHIRNNLTYHTPTQGVLYDIIFKKNDLIHARVYAGHEGGTGNFTFFWNFQALRNAINDLTQQAMRSILRNHDITFQTSNDYPHKHLGFAKQLHDGSTGRGAALSNFGDLWFSGYIDTSGGGSGWTDAFAGLIFDDGRGSDSQSFHRFSSAYDLYALWAHASFVKVEPQQNAAGTDYWFEILKPLLNRGGTTRTLNATDFENDKEIEFEQPGNAIKSVQYAIPGMRGEDIADKEVVSDIAGIEVEEKRPLRMLFHNLPMAGDRNENYQRGRAGTIGINHFEREPLPDITDDHIAVALAPTFPVWQLWYFDTPTVGGTALTTVEVAIRVNQEVYIDAGHGISTVYPTPISEWPSVNHPASYDPETQSWYTDILDAILTVQGASGLPYSVAAEGANLFGTKTQTIYRNLTIDSRLIDCTMIGETFHITGGDTANVFLPSGHTEGAWLGAVLTVLSVEEDQPKGSSKITALVMQ